MKQLTCEMCGGTNLVKQDGMFVCQSCGCKYTLEEARKMMGADSDPAETASAGSATVKVDTSEKLAKLYQIARRAKDDNNAEGAAKYYDLILQEDPMSWEAAFYTVYYSAMQTNIAGIENAAHRVHNCLGSVLGLIREHVPQAEQAEAVQDLAYSVMNISTMLAGAALSHYNDIDPDIKSQYTQEYIDRVAAARDTLYDLGDMIEKTFSNPDCLQSVPQLWKLGIVQHKTLLPHLSNQAGNNKTIDRYAAKIGKYDPSYQNSRKAESLKAQISDIDQKIIALRAVRKPKLTSGIILAVLSLLLLFLPRFIIQTEFAYSWFNMWRPLIITVMGAWIEILGIGGLQGKRPLGSLWACLGLLVLLYGVFSFPTFYGFLSSIPFLGYLPPVSGLAYGISTWVQFQRAKSTQVANQVQIEELQQKRDALQEEINALV